MNKANGYTLLEGLFSLGVMALISISIIPMILQLFQNLNLKKEETELLQAIYDESERLLIHPFEAKVDLKRLTIRSIKQEGRWIICADSKKKQRCFPM